MRAARHLRAAAVAGMALLGAGAALAQSSVADVPVGTAIGDETKCLALTVYWEGKTESRKGQLAIAHTVLNRMHNRQFPGTICGVVSQRSDDGKVCQFSWWCDGKRDEPADDDAWQTSLSVARQAMAGGQDPSGHALYFHAAGARPGWIHRKKRVARIGNHIFYR